MTEAQRFRMGRHQLEPHPSGEWVRASEVGLHGRAVALVLAIDPANGDQYGIFPDIEAATTWADKQSCPCVVVHPMIIGEPDFGNTVQQ